MSAWPHGTRPRYRSGCKCLPCRSANADYARTLRYPESDELASAGQQGTVDATPARDYLAQLQRLGVGYRRAALLADLSPQAVLDIRSGRRARIRPETSAAILSVRPSLAHGQVVSSQQTFKLLDSLRREGFARERIAGWLGFKGAQIRFTRIGGKVRVSSHLKVKALWEFLMSEDGGAVEIGDRDDE